MKYYSKLHMSSLSEGSYVLDAQRTCNWCDVKLKEFTSEKERVFVDFLAKGAQVRRLLFLLMTPVSFAKDLYSAS